MSNSTTDSQIGPFLFPFRWTKINFFFLNLFPVPLSGLHINRTRENGHFLIMSFSFSAIAPIHTESHVTFAVKKERLSLTVGWSTRTTRQRTLDWRNNQLFPSTRDMEINESRRPQSYNFFFNWKTNGTRPIKHVTKIINKNLSEIADTSPKWRT